MNASKPALRPAGGPIVFPGRNSGFGAGIRQDSSRENIKIGPRTGRRADVEAFTTRIRPKSEAGGPISGPEALLRNMGHIACKESEVDFLNTSILKTLRAFQYWLSPWDPPPQTPRVGGLPPPDLPAGGFGGGIPPTRGVWGVGAPQSEKQYWVRLTGGF